MFARAIIFHIGNLFKYGHLSRIARLHKLHKIHLEIIAYGPYCQPDGTARLSYTLSMKDMDKAQALLFYETSSLLCVVNSATPTLVSENSYMMPLQFVKCFRPS